MFANYIFKSEKFDDVFIYNYNAYRTGEEDADVKLHISFHWEDYVKCHEDIRQIIVKHMQQGTLDIFKFINVNLTFSSPAEERYKLGDQFTIYLPNDDIATASIINLCTDLNTYIMQQNLRPGGKGESADNITDHINMRIEYIRDGERKIRIQGGSFNLMNPTERKLAIIAKELLQEDELFQTLHQHFYGNNIGDKTLQPKQLENNNNNVQELPIEDLKNEEKQKKNRDRFFHFKKPHIKKSTNGIFPFKIKFS